MEKVLGEIGVIHSTFIKEFEDIVCHGQKQMTTNEKLFFRAGLVASSTTIDRIQRLIGEDIASKGFPDQEHLDFLSKFGQENRAFAARELKDLSEFCKPGLSRKVEFGEA